MASDSVYLGFKVVYNILILPKVIYTLRLNMLVLLADATK